MAYIESHCRDASHVSNHADQGDCHNDHQILIGCDYLQGCLKGDFFITHIRCNDFFCVLEHDEEHRSGDQGKDNCYHCVSFAGNDFRASGELCQKESCSEAYNHDTDLHADTSGGVQLCAIVIMCSHNTCKRAVRDVCQCVEHSGSNVSECCPDCSSGSVSERCRKCQDAEDCK